MTAFWLALGASASAETRIALVIGNGAYKWVTELANPPNDAADVADALKSLGFEVIQARDADQARMESLIAEFAKRAATADVSLFYYGGHGVQVSSHNYLIPVDARLHSVEDIDKHTIHFDDVLAALAQGSGIHLVFLDACRENPIKNSSVTLKSTGLARVGNAAGFLIAFATQPDNVAFDGAGRNSPFAHALLDHVATPGADISSMMISVRRDVIASTGGAQVPWENSSLTRQFYFAGAASGDVSPETMLWQLAGGQRDPNLLRIYLERYPNGSHANDVRSLLPQTGVGKPEPGPTTGSAVEDEMWRLALDARERSLVELYLTRYPSGGHAREAAALLSSLKEAEAIAGDPAIVCERLATVPADATASARGVDMATLAVHASEAVEACQRAVTERPEIPHYLALLARATFASGHFDAAVALYRKAADAGDARAMVSLGLLMESGGHVRKDVKGAYTLYEKAAARGNADGAINLGFALAQGLGIAKDVPRAFSLFQQASQVGSARATYDLATLISAGVGGKSSEALDLFERAASLGEPKGDRAAAVLLDEGRGVPRDADAAADEMLRCVSVDSGECLAELAGKTQTWTPETIEAIQSKLKSAGFYNGPIDGRGGPTLAPALRQWRLRGPPPKA